jgi:hypothetical protein
MAEVFSNVRSKKAGAAQFLRVKSVKGQGLELIVTLRSNRISSLALRELIALHSDTNYQ